MTLLRQKQINQQLSASVWSGDIQAVVAGLTLDELQSTYNDLRMQYALHLRDAAQAESLVVGGVLVPADGVGAGNGYRSR